MRTLAERLNALLALDEGRKDEYRARLLRPLKGLPELPVTVELYPNADNRADAEAYLSQFLSHPVLRRRDWLDWWCRFVRLVLLENWWSHEYLPNANETYDAVWAAVMAEFRAVARRSGVTPETLYQTVKRFWPAMFLSDVTHYVSTPVPEIQNFHPAFELPEPLLRTLRAFEAEWKKKVAHLITPEEAQTQGAVPVLDCGGGFVWFKIPKQYCEIEAKKMGHCGNSGNPHEGDEILSLREAVPNRPDHWDIHLTFIINNGILGEMKGRGNDKPVPKYHPMIVKLLESDLVQGIAGGGYMPENNFALTDLPQAERERLGALKPGLLSFPDQFKAEGLSDAFVNRIAYAFLVNNLEYAELVRGDGNPVPTDALRVDHFKNLSQFAEEFDPRHGARFFCRLLMGEDDVSWYAGSVPDDSTAKEWAENALDRFPDLHRAVVGALRAEFGEEFLAEFPEEEYGDFSEYLPDADALWEFCEMRDVEWFKNAVVNAYADADSQGYADAVYEKARYYFENFYSDTQARLYFTPEGINGPCFLAFRGIDLALSLQYNSTWGDGVFDGGSLTRFIVDKADDADVDVSYWEPYEEGFYERVSDELRKAVGEYLSKPVGPPDQIYIDYTKDYSERLARRLARAVRRLTE